MLERRLNCKLTRPEAATPTPFILHRHGGTMNSCLPSDCYIGVDVAQHELVAAVFGQAGVTTCAHAPAAVNAWLATLPETVHLGVESTGDYHRLLAERAHARGITVYVLNPHDVHHYARALGRRAKTDRVDAALLARYLAQEHAGLHPWQPPTPAQDRLTPLLKRRAKVVVAKGLLRASLAGLDIVQAERDATLNPLDALLTALDRASPPAVPARSRGTAPSALSRRPECGSDRHLETLLRTSACPRPVHHRRPRGTRSHAGARSLCIA